MNLLVALGPGRVAATLAGTALIVVAALLLSHLSDTPSPAIARTGVPAQLPIDSEAPTQSPPVDTVAARAAAVRFGAQYFAYSWQESSSAALARLKPLMTSDLVVQWNAQLTPAQIAAQESATVLSCSATPEGDDGGSLGFVVDAQVRITNAQGSSTSQEAIEVSLVRSSGAWLVDQVTQ